MILLFPVGTLSLQPSEIKTRSPEKHGSATCAFLNKEIPFFGNFHSNLVIAFKVKSRILLGVGSSIFIPRYGRISRPSAT